MVKIGERVLSGLQYLRKQIVQYYAQSYMPEELPFIELSQGAFRKLPTSVAMSMETITCKDEITTTVWICDSLKGARI